VVAAVLEETLGAVSRHPADGCAQRFHQTFKATNSFSPQHWWSQIPQFHRTSALKFRALLTEGVTWQVELIRA
jgi:hypothetical protein